MALTDHDAVALAILPKMLEIIRAADGSKRKTISEFETTDLFRLACTASFDFADVYLEVKQARAQSKLNERAPTGRPTPRR